MASRYEILLRQEDPFYGKCPKGGNHEWGTDGQHSNQYCKKCFLNRPEPPKLEDKYITENNKTISLFSEKKCFDGQDHVWGIDGAHSNVYCKKCFMSKPEDTPADPYEDEVDLKKKKEFDITDLNG